MDLVPVLGFMADVLLFCSIAVFNTPGVAGTVLQTPPLLIQ